MNKETETQLENRIFKIILWTTIMASCICIVGNYIFGFPLNINAKWIALILVSGFSLRMIKKSQKYLPSLRLFFFLFIILVIIPFGWIDSGGSDNNTIAYVFLLLSSNHKDSQQPISILRSLGTNSLNSWDRIFAG